MSRRQAIDHRAGQALREAARLLEEGRTFALVTVVGAAGASPRKVGARMVVTPDGQSGSVGGGGVERLAVEKARQALKSGEVIRLELDLDDPERLQTGMLCGGRMELLIEPFGSAPILHLFGAGHVAMPTARLAQEVGFRVTVYDPRADWLTSERFPGAALRRGAYAELAESLDPSPDDFIAVITPCHDDDYTVVTRVLRKPFRYLGMIGSRRKAVEIRKRLEADGFSPDEIKRLTCPIGADIPSHTPEEIAVAVAAQLIAVKNAGQD